MPKPGMAWRHIVINTLNSWHHGDARGFHSRGHRIHSSGDYKNLPPRDEHAGLLRYQQSISGPPIDIAESLRATVGKAFATAFVDLQFQLLAVAVADKHTHAVVELPYELAEVRLIVGEAKRKSSRSVKHALPGRIWAAGGTYKLVRDESHFRNAAEYVLYDQGDDAWTWSYSDKTYDGMFGRRRSNPGRR